jgi:aerobic carbon-monoxide dehydrogenase large subunit
MDDNVDGNAQTAQPPVLGAPIHCREDREMLLGEAEFIADIALPGMVHMELLYSEQAHANVTSVDARAAAKMPGVIRIITAADIDGKINRLPCVWIPGGVQSKFPSHPSGVPGGALVLAGDRVRYVGDPIAAVVAETAQQARAAVAAVEVSYRPLPVILDAEAAIEPGAPQLHAEVPNNLNAYIPYGNQQETDRAIAAAETVIRLSTHIPRTINSPIEPRGSIGKYDAATGEYTLWASTQSPHNHRLLLALMVLGIPFNKLRVVAPNVGGSFGTKGYVYPDMALVLWLSKELGRPVKWVDTREGMMRGTVQGRDQKMTGVLAGTRDGKILALRCKSYANLGAYPSTIGPGVATAMVGRCITGVYDVPNAFCEIYAAFTNTAPLGAQRGSGRTEATYLTERLIEAYAREIGMDPAIVRQKNLVRPSQFPFENRLGWTYDSGDYPACMKRVLEMAEYSTAAARKTEAKARRKLLGIGLSSFVAISGVGPSPRMAREGMLGGTWESAVVRVHPTGELTLAIGSKPHGQHHETTFSQIVAQELGIDVGKIEVLHSDTERSPFGQGSYGSRSFSVGGAAALEASRAVKKKAMQAAAHVYRQSFGVDVEGLVYENGRIYPKGEPAKAKTLQEVALALWYGWDIPPGMEPTLEHTTFFDPKNFNFPYGCHVAEVEVDQSTFEVEITRYSCVHDVGVMGNAKVVEGQLIGAIVFGLGEALLERAVYSPEGQLETRSFADYPLPRARHIPRRFDLDMMVTPNPNTALGAKGCGELGTVGAVSAIANAVFDAVGPLGVRHLDLPLTPFRLWEAVQAVEAKRR